jgi:hypothetical protein
MSDKSGKEKKTSGNFKRGPQKISMKEKANSAEQPINVRDEMSRFIEKGSFIMKIFGKTTIIKSRLRKMF